MTNIILYLFEISQKNTTIIIKDGS